MSGAAGAAAAASPLGRHASALRLYRAATQVTQELGIRAAQDLLELVCGFRCKILELFDRLGRSPAERLSAVTVDEFTSLLGHYTDKWDSMRFDVAMARAVHQVSEKVERMLPRFKEGADAEAFLGGAWVRCRVVGHEVVTGGRVKVTWQNDAGERETVQLPRSLVRFALANGMRVEAADAMGKWWPASITQVLEDDDEVDLQVYSPFDVFEVEGVLRSAIRDATQVLGGYRCRPFKPGDEVFVVEEVKGGSCENRGRNVPTFKWRPAEIGGVDESTGLYLLHMQDTEAAAGQVVPDAGKVPPLKGALPHSIRRRFAVGDEVCLVPTRAEKEQAAAADLAIDSLLTPFTIQHVNLSRDKIGYTVESLPSPPSLSSSSSSSSSAKRSTRENVLPSHISRRSALQAADAQLFWTGTAADGAGLLDSGAAPSWTVGAENNFGGDSSPELALSAVPGAIASGLRDIFDTVECLSPGTTRGAVDFQDFSKFYEFCTGLSLQADQRRNIWLRLGKPSSGCELSDGDTGARLQVIVPGGDGTATSVNPVDRPSNDEVLRFGLGGELELEEWLACGATLFPCLGQARFLELIEEFRNSLAVAAQHDFPRIEVGRPGQAIDADLRPWPVTVLGQNPDFSYSVEVNDGHQTRWTRVRRVDVSEQLTERAIFQDSQRRLWSVKIVAEDSAENGQSSFTVQKSSLLQAERLEAVPRCALSAPESISLPLPLDIMVEATVSSGQSSGAENHWTFITPRAYNSFDGTYYCEGVGSSSPGSVDGHDGVDVAICRRSLVNGSCCRRQVTSEDSSTLQDLVVTSVDDTVVAYNCLAASSSVTKSSPSNQTTDASTACASEVSFEKVHVRPRDVQRVDFRQALDVFLSCLSFDVSEQSTGESQDDTDGLELQILLERDGFVPLQATVFVDGNCRVRMDLNGLVQDVTVVAKYALNPPPAPDFSEWAQSSVNGFASDAILLKYLQEQISQSLHDYFLECRSAYDAVITSAGADTFSTFSVALQKPGRPTFLTCTLHLTDIMPLGETPVAGQRMDEGGDNRSRVSTGRVQLVFSIEYEGLSKRQQLPLPADWDDRVVDALIGQKQRKIIEDFLTRDASSFDHFIRPTAHLDRYSVTFSQPIQDTPVPPCAVRTTFSLCSGDWVRFSFEGDTLEQRSSEQHRFRDIWIEDAMRKKIALMNTLQLEDDFITSRLQPLSSGIPKKQKPVHMKLSF